MSVFFVILIIFIALWTSMGLPIYIEHMNLDTDLDKLHVFTLNNFFIAIVCGPVAWIVWIMWAIESIISFLIKKLKS